MEPWCRDWRGWQSPHDPFVRIILGIGNIGGQYLGTRHNVGFDVVDLLATRHGLTQWSRKHHAQICSWRSEHGPVLLVKPETYVNGSGEAAQALLAFHQALPADLLVVVDDLNLALGTLRLRPDGSAGGHNGLRDIESRIGTAYPRLRIGIGAPPGTGDAQIAHVLGRWSEPERADMNLMLGKAGDCVERWLSQGIAAASVFNGPLRPPPPRPKPPKPSPEPPPAVPET
jgi:peptidyl-tRNA hydrolase, PTH1 family